MRASALPIGDGACHAAGILAPVGTPFPDVGRQTGFMVLYLIRMLPIDGRAKQVAQVIVIIIGIVSLLRYLAVF